MLEKIFIHQSDPDLACAMHSESVRQENHIELIASENYCSPAVMKAQGSDLTNKYAEGYPGQRYYGGCEYVDIIEKLAIERAKKLFNADFVNVQPHSGSQANEAVFLALLEPQDTVLAMKLSEGGHLTHGAKVNASGKKYNFVHYGLNSKTGEIDYDEVEYLTKKYRPKLIIAGFSAYSPILDWQRFREIADTVDAWFMADMAHVAGLVATGYYPSPVQIADVTTTTTHKTLRGPRSGLILAKSNPLLEKKLNSAVFPGIQGGPLMHVIAAKAICFKEAMQEDFRIYQGQVIKNAQVMAEVIIERGYDVVSGGTKNHLLLVSLISQAITGKQADEWLGQAFITVNKNVVPNDPQSAFVTSGIRLGTPAITTRGFREEEVRQVAGWICDILDSKGDSAVIKNIRNNVIELCDQFPIYELHKS